MAAKKSFTDFTILDIMAAYGVPLLCEPPFLSERTIKMANSTLKTTRRKKGTGNIEKKSNGTYLGKLRVSGYDTFYYTGTSEKEVQKKLNEFYILTQRKEIVPQRQTVNAYIETWLSTIKKPSLKPASFDRLERTFEKQIKNTNVGRSQLGNLTTMEIQQLINSYTKTLSYSSLKKVFMLLNECLVYAVTVRDLGYNPADGVKLPKRENLVIKTKEIHILSVEDLNKLEEAQYSTYSSGQLRFRYAPAYILIAHTGLRSGEALALTWDKVDFIRSTITVSQNASRIKNRNANGICQEGSRQIITSTKTQTGSRTIPLNKKALNALNMLKEQQTKQGIETDFVIATSSGKMVVQNSFYRIFQNMQKSLGIQPVSVHALRHTFASNLIKANIDVKVVSQLLGHSSVKITYDTYVHTDIKRAASAVMVLE